MDSKKGKSITTSVPSISIKFHADEEPVIELCGDDDDFSFKSSATAPPSVSTSSLTEPEGSPLKFLPRLGKRSTSIDVSPTAPENRQDSPSWRFLSDIKEKFAKSVEDRLSEIKGKGQEEDSPVKGKLDKFNKDNSSFSDSEDMSESSISKTCGMASTTEGVEMSSEDETLPLEKEKKNEALKFSKPKIGLRQRFRLLKSKSSPIEGSVSVSNLSRLYNINADSVEQSLPEQTEEVESAVDALLDENFQDTSATVQKVVSHDEVLDCLQEKFDNVEIDDEKILNVKEVSGNEAKLGGTVFAPVGFVDLRNKRQREGSSFVFPTLILGLAITHYFIEQYSPYFSGVMAGIAVTIVFRFLKDQIYPEPNTRLPKTTIETLQKDILEIPAVKEYQPIIKYEGWLNELPDNYNPSTYHISQTQSVYLRLQGNILRISNTSSKVPKRAMWNEPPVQPKFTFHRVYNLTGATVALFPPGLTKIRHWSKKYPICVSLSNEQLKFGDETLIKDLEEEENVTINIKPEINSEKKRFSFRKNKKSSYANTPQQYSKLAEHEYLFSIESEASRSNTPSPDSEENNVIVDLPAKPIEKEGQEIDNDSLTDGWSNCTLDDSPTETKLYLFGRTDREKEDWFRRLNEATCENLQITKEANDLCEDNQSKNSIFVEYSKYMSCLNKSPKKSKEADTENVGKISPSLEVAWLNTLIGRVMFDCMCDPNFTGRLKDRIQRKLSTIKLPYFIEEISITELNLGKTPSKFFNVSKPVIDQRGLWVDLDLKYEGVIVLTLMTKINLMKLKQPHENDKSSLKSAIFHSDVDDSAESSSDEESDINVLPSESGTTGKKFIKMVDRIAESKFFQAATEYRYIKKAMEGVSNTDLRLKVEIKGIEGVLTLNIPPPPSDRLWIGFQPNPKIFLFAHPIVGERNITFLYITSWIEKKLIQEFQKVLVLPNMEDFIIPVMMSKLPE